MKDKSKLINRPKYRMILLDKASSNDKIGEIKSNLGETNYIWLLSKSDSF